MHAATVRMASVIASRAMPRDMMSLRWVWGCRALSARSNARDAGVGRICRQRRMLAVSRPSGCPSITLVRALAHTNGGISLASGVAL